MRKIISYATAAVLTLPLTLMGSPNSTEALRTTNVPERPASTRAHNVLDAPIAAAVIQPQKTRRKKRGSEWGRKRRGSGVKGAVGKAGNRFGRGTARLGKGSASLVKNVAVGRPVRGGKNFGKGAGSFGKNTGIAAGYTGVAAGRTGARIGKGTAKAAKVTGRVTGRAVKRAVTP